MICPGNNVDCDNPGCRRGGCQGRSPEPPLFQLMGLDRPFAGARRLSEDDVEAPALAPDREPAAA